MAGQLIIDILDAADLPFVDIDPVGVQMESNRLRDDTAAAGFEFLSQDEITTVEVAYVDLLATEPEADATGFDQPAQSVAIVEGPEAADVPVREVDQAIPGQVGEPETTTGVVRLEMDEGC